MILTKLVKLLSSTRKNMFILPLKSTITPGANILVEFKTANVTNADTIQIPRKLTYTSAFSSNVQT